MSGNLAEVIRLEPLAVNIDGLRLLLGDPHLSRTAIWALEKRGLIERVPGIRRCLYTVKSVRRFVEGKQAA